MDDNTNRMSDEELDRWVQDLLAGQQDDTETVELEESDNDCCWREGLEQAIDANRPIRDDNHIHGDAILLYTEATGTLEEVAFIDLPLRFPLLGKGARWSYADLGELLTAKSVLYRQSCAANDLADEYPDATPECGTVCLVQHADQHVLSWCQVRARIDPALNR